MEKLDAIVAAGGALILLVAIAAAALSGSASSSFDVRAASVATPLPGGSNAHTAEQQPVRDSFTISVNGSNLTELDLTVTSSYLAGPGGKGAMHATLTAPNGTKFDMDGNGSASGGTQAALVAAFTIPLSVTPANQTVDAASADAAAAKVASTAPSNASGAAAGTWKLDVSFTIGPTPVPSLTTSWKGSLVAYTLTATPRSLGSK